MTQTVEPLDHKFTGTIRRNSTGQIVSPDRWVVFDAADAALPYTLREYRIRCVQLGAEHLQIEAIDRLRHRVTVWREENADQIKVPDTVPGQINSDPVPFDPDAIRNTEPTLTDYALAAMQGMLASGTPWDDRTLQTAWSIARQMVAQQPKELGATAALPTSLVDSAVSLAETIEEQSNEPATESDPQPGA